MAAAWNDLPATGGLHECAALVSSAEALRVSAPELSVQLARRALLVGATDASAGTTHIGEARNLSMRAQALLASGLVRISQHARAVEPGFAALGLAEAGGAPDVAAEVRIDLAACAQQVGEPLLGGALLRPVLESTQVPPSVRAAALGRLVGCIAHVARRDDVEDALTEADRLLAVDDGISPDMRRLERARLAVRSAGYHRWYGDTEDAVTASREGLNLLARLRNELRSECDRLRARLTLELVCGLLDEGELHEAEAAAHPVVDEPVRATSAASVGRLMLALATRVYLPSGQMDRGRHLLDQAAWMAERHALDGLRADALTEVSRLDEQAGRAADALEALRTARAAEHRRMRAMSRAARHVLVEVGADNGIRDSTQQSVAALMRQLAHPAGIPVAAVAPSQVSPPPAKSAPEPPAPPQPTAEVVGTVDMEETTRLLDREGLFRRLRTVRTGERPVALTLVRVEPARDGAEDRGPDTGIMAGLADKVRDMAPDNAELARSDGGELAVLLPATTRDQAEEFAATIRETAIESDWAGASGKDMSISTSVVQTDQANTDAAGMLTAARGALTPAQTTTTPEPTPKPTPAPNAGAATSAGAGTGTTARASAKTSTVTNAGTSPGTNAGPGARTSTGTSAGAGAGTKAVTNAEAGAGTNAGTTADASQGTGPNSLADTAAALNSALSEETPTRPLNAKPPTESQHEGRSILSSLSIPSGSGGRRRAGEEQPPGGKSRWPAEPAEAPRWTRAERRAQQESTWPTDPTPTPPTGWPTQADEPSQGKRAATPTKPSFSETRTGEATTAINRTTLPAQQPAVDHAPRTTEPATTQDDERPTRRDRSTPATAASNAKLQSLIDPELAARHRTTSGTPATASSETSGAASAPARSRRQPVSAAEPGFGVSLGSEDAGTVGESARSASRNAPAAESGAGGEEASAASGLARWVRDKQSALAAAAEAGSGDDAAGAADQAEFSRRHHTLASTTFGTSLNGDGAGTADDSGHSAHRADSPAAEPARSAGDAATFDAEHATQHAASADEPTEATTWAAGDSAFAGSSSGGVLRTPSESAADSAARKQSSYEETKAELARMMSALNAKSLGARDGNEVRQPIPTPEEAKPEPPAARPEPQPEPGRSGLMAAFDALTGPVPDLRTEFDDAPDLPARKPAQSWAQVEAAAVVESPADKLFGTTSGERPKFRSALGAAFAEFGATEKKVTEPVKEPVQETVYDEPIGPQPRPEGPPRRGEKSSATIASLLTEALAAYQSTAEDAEDAEDHRAPERFDSFVGDDQEPQQSGVQGRHRSPE